MSSINCPNCGATLYHRDGIIFCHVCTQRDLDSKRTLIQKLHNQLDEANEKIGKLLEHCDKGMGECTKCSEIVCQHKDSLHLHHDGCPSCTCDEMEVNSKIADPFKDMWELSQGEIARLREIKARAEYLFKSIYDARLKNDVHMAACKMQWLAEDGINLLKSETPTP
jgi:uncharacterized Zn finger protein (UPF0148 family)